MGFYDGNIASAECRQALNWFALQRLLLQYLGGGGLEWVGWRENNQGKGWGAGFMVFKTRPAARNRRAFSENGAGGFYLFGGQRIWSRS